jgi:hypothetical protein
MEGITMEEHTLLRNRMTGSIRTVAVTTTAAAHLPRGQEVVSNYTNIFFSFRVNRHL